MNRLTEAGAKIVELQDKLKEINQRLSHVQGTAADIRADAQANRQAVKKARAEAVLRGEKPQVGNLHHAYDTAKAELETINQELSDLRDAGGYLRDAIKIAEDERDEVLRARNERHREEFDKRLKTWQRDTARVLVQLERGHFNGDCRIDRMKLIKQMLGEGVDSKMILHENLGALENQMDDARAWFDEKEVNW